MMNREVGKVKVMAGRAALQQQEVADLLRRLLVEICGISSAAISDEASLDEELQIDSSQLAQVQVELEDSLDISIDFLEILRLQRFGSIVSYLQSLAERA